MLGELLRVLLVSLELPPAETAQAIGNALPGSGFYGVDTILKPAPQNPFIERLPIDDDMVQAIHGHAIAASSASHSGLQTVRSKDSSPGPSRGPTISRAPHSKLAASSGSVLGSGSNAIWRSMARTIR